MTRRFLGIARERVFSPGRVEDDAAILDLVAGHLRQFGHAVSVFSADDDQWPDPGPQTTVFAMCQGAAALARLRQWQARGLRIVNRPQAIFNCQRHRMVDVFAQAGIAAPETVLADTAAPAALPSWAAGGAWVKRGDVHAVAADDVVYVGSATAARDVLRRFGARGIRQVAVQRHVPGIVCKFYAVRGSFFHCVPPDGGKAISADGRRRMAALGERAAAALDVEVYGGDCVGDAHGTLRLIDLNDWPSYARCRVEAAEHIAAHLHEPSVAIEA
jgi:hypothetical protein